MSHPCKICNIRRRESFEVYINPKCNICSKCIKCENAYSEYICENTFEISKEDLKKLEKYIGVDGICYYDREQITKMVIETSNNKNVERDMKQKIRKDILMNKLRDLKLQYKKNSICDAYIKYGSPDLKTVVENLVQKQTDRGVRFTKMIKYLEKHNMRYDDKIPCFEDYLNENIELRDIRDNYEIDIFLVNETDYINLLLKYDRDTARELAINESIKTHGINKFNNCFSINFD
jgi:uncharacterized protein Usg